MARKSKYVYRCGFPKCGKGVSTAVGPSDYPWCHGAHSRQMDFIEAESGGIPEHVEEKDKKRKKEGRWIEA